MIGMIIRPNRKIYLDLAKQFNMDSRVIEAICKSPFQCAADVMKDPEDMSPIMFTYLGKIKIKSTHERPGKRFRRKTQEEIEELRAAEDRDKKA